MTDAKTIDAAFAGIAKNFEALRALAPKVAEAGAIWVATIAAGNKIMFCGNGGSAADAQHMAAELLGRYMKERRALPALALTTDTSALTAIANDYAYDAVFERQLRGLGRRGDTLVAISTSGKSPNVLKAAQAAREMGIRVVALTGAKPSPLADLADIALAVPATTANRIQEMHIAIGHLLCGMVEDAVS